MPTPLPFDAVGAYLAPFRGAFRRGDQLRWAGVYLRGLLGDLPRKNVRALGARAEVSQGGAAADPAQALHNFVSQSPWDEEEVWRRYREVTARRFARADGVFVVEEVAFPKRGGHSVGVQRQFSAALGRKVSCQVAVALHYVSAAGCCPLALRLYLPARWLGDARRLDAVGVPEPARRPLSRWQIGLELYNRVRAEGFEGRALVLGLAAPATPDLLDAVDRCGVPAMWGAAEETAVLWQGPGPELPGARRPRATTLGELVRQTTLRRLGTPGHPDRAAWLQVHLAEESPRHGRGVGLLIEQDEGGLIQLALANRPEGIDTAAAAAQWRARRHAQAQLARQKRELGLGDFEGRSWRGFHHHACLVALAWGAALSADAPPSP